MTNKPLYDDPVVAEIRSIREKMLADCDGKPQEHGNTVVAESAQPTAPGGLGS